MVKLNIENILKEKNKSKYWLCLEMNITYKSLNQIIKGKTSSISFKYLEDFCNILECSLDELIIINYTNEKNVAIDI